MELDESLIDKIVVGMLAGNFLEPVAMSLGVEPTTIRNWMWTGKRISKKEIGITTEHRKLCLELYRRVTMARGAVELDFVEKLKNSSNKHEFNVWAHILKCKFPERWNPTATMTKVLDQEQILNVLEKYLKHDQYLEILNALNRNEGITRSSYEGEEETPRQRVSNSVH